MISLAWSPSKGRSRESAWIGGFTRIRESNYTHFHLTVNIESMTFSSALAPLFFCTTKVDLIDLGLINSAFLCFHEYCLAEVKNHAVPNICTWTWLVNTLASLLH